MRPGALLLDLDGTIFQGRVLIPGALETLLFLQKAKIPYRFITNTTRMTKKKLVLMMKDMGLSVSSDDIFAAPHAAAIYCQNKGYKKILLTVPDREMEEDFSDFQLVDYNPDAIVLGDMGAGFTFNLINDLFNHILGGSELVAMHKNRFWKSADGYSLDVGAFVSALEYASGRPASIMGKPNSNLFVLASREWSLPAEKILMVGDDIEGDVCGALNAGMKSILVKTGKFRDETLQSSDIKPGYIIDSIADLPGIIDLD
jgi:HAD superfamily hydrolase (TIGR01458 family)